MTRFGSDCIVVGVARQVQLFNLLSSCGVKMNIDCRSGASMCVCEEGGRERIK